MATAKQLPSGSWRCLVFDKMENGKRKYKSFTADTKRKAELLAAEYLNGDNASLPDSTFEESMDLFLRLRKPVVSPSTMRGYKTIEKNLKIDCERFCTLRTASIKTNDIQTVIDYYAKDHASKTVHNIYGLIISVIKTVNESAAFKVRLPQKKRAELYIPTDDEIQRILDASKSNPGLRIPILLGSCCGLRRSEICALTIEDLDGCVMHIHRAKVKDENGKWIVKLPKTYGSDRFIQIPSFVSDEIIAYGAITSYEPNSLSKAFWSTLDRLHIQHFRFHDLRHYAISVRHAIGIPDAYIMADSGHTAPSTMQNIYRHALSKERIEMAEKTNEHFDNMFNK